MSARDAAQARADLAAQQLEDVAEILDRVGHGQLAQALRILAGQIGFGDKPWHAQIAERLLRRPGVTASMPTRPITGGPRVELPPVALRTHRRAVWGSGGGFWRLALRVPDGQGWHLFSNNPRGRVAFRSHVDREDLVSGPGWEDAKVELPALVEPPRRAAR